MSFDPLGFAIGIVIGAFLATYALHKAIDASDMVESTWKVAGRALRYLVSPSFYGEIFMNILNAGREFVDGLKGK